jgi:pyruvate/2-oxoglutarate dehydrogenase complex dihydrolipoamide acyltransferase (E2) component
MTTPLSTSEPNRLSEELGENSSSLERALLRAGSSYASSPQTRVRVLAGLGLAAGSTALFTGSAAAASAAASSAAKLTWTKLLLGVSLVGATAVPVSYYALHSAAPAGTPAPRAAVSAPAVAEPAPAPAPAVAATPAAALLTEELGALDHARLALVNGEGRRTLDELDAYDRRFPSGRLQIEAEVLRIDALSKLGRKDAARQRAEAFLRRYPNSVLATRVRAHVAD